MDSSDMDSSDMDSSDMDSSDMDSSDMDSSDMDSSDTDSSDMDRADQARQTRHGVHYLNVSIEKLIAMQSIIVLMFHGGISIIIALSHRIMIDIRKNILLFRDQILLKSILKKKLITIIIIIIMIFPCCIDLSAYASVQFLSNCNIHVYINDIMLV